MCSQDIQIPAVEMVSLQPSFTSSLIAHPVESNFYKAKDKERGAAKRSSRYQSHQGDKYATPDSTRGRIDDGPLHADHRRLFMLCWAARASDVLIPPLLLNDGGRFAHVNG
jgi:hypothetical protein